MKYDGKKAKRVVDEKRVSWECPKSFYEALNKGGLKYLRFKHVQKKLDWNSRTTLEDFVQLWKMFLDEVSLTKVNISVGDIILEKKTVKSNAEKLNQELSEILFVEKVDDSPEIEVTVVSTGKKTTLNKHKLEFSNYYTVLRFSKLGQNLHSYHRILFYTTFKMNQTLLGILILLCCPEVITQSGKPRKNAVKSIFSYFTCKDLQAITENLKDKNIRKTIDRKFICDLIDEADNQGISLPFDQKVKDQITNEYSDLKSFSTAANNFIHGTASEKIYEFFEDNNNKRLFQERFSCILQLYFLLYPKNIPIEKPENPDAYDGNGDNSITEYITFPDSIFKLATNVIRYFSDNDDTTHIQVTSLFSLAGYIFDSIRPNKLKRSGIVDEFEQYRENILCYGEGRLDFYFALRRYKGVNKYAAEKLSEIYYFGRTFEGFTVKKDIRKSIEMLNSCEDNSISARWSLGENYMRLSEQKEGQEQKQYVDQARILFENCDNYPPALNSQARLLMRKIRDRDINCISQEEAVRSVRKAIELATKAARLGWVYAFNNLYAWLSDKDLQQYLDDEIGKETIGKAYSLLSASSKGFAENSSQRKRENELNSVMQNLSSGITKVVENYIGDLSKITFRFRNPINSTPSNFLVVSAYYDNLYAINHLGLEFVKEGDKKTAKLLFEYAAVYGEWGYRNLARNIYRDKMIKKLLEERADEIKKQTDTWRTSNPSIQLMDLNEESFDNSKKNSRRSM